MIVTFEMIQEMNPDKIIEPEVYRPVAGYEDYYEVSNWGNVRSKERKVCTVRSNGRPYHQTIKPKILSIHATTKNSKPDYCYVWLEVDPKPRNCTVHRLVGNAFIANPHDLPMFNHIDGNKQNNYYKNLEPCTASHNIRESFRLGLSNPNTQPMIVAGKKASCKPVYVKELDTYFESGTLCTEYLNLPPDYVNRIFQLQKTDSVYGCGYTFERVSRKEFDSVIGANRVEY